MVNQDVDMVICPSYWCFEDAGGGIRHDANAEIKLVNALCVTRAFENEVILVYADEVHIHRDLDLGYTWGRQGERLWRQSD